MPPQFALILCLVFVCLLLKYDHKQARNVSWEVWIPTVWMLIASSRSIDQWVGITGGSRETGGFLDPIVQIGLLILGFSVIFRRKLDWPKMGIEHAWLVLLIIFMLLSTFWADSMFIALKRWIREFTACIMGVMIASERNPRQAVTSLLRRTIYILIPVSVLMIKYYRELGAVHSRFTGEVQWIGVALQKNGLGRLCLISAFVLLWTFVSRWQRRTSAIGRVQTSAEILLLAMTVWLFKGPSSWAASKSATASFGAGVACYLWLLWTRTHRVRVGHIGWVSFIGLIMIVGTVQPFVGGATVSGFSSMLGRDETLTGRTFIWESLVPDVIRRPFLGYGVASFFTVSRIVENDIGEAHNGYLEVILCLGFVGLFLTAMFLLVSTRRAAMLLSRDYEMGSLTLSMLTMAAVHNIGESSFDSLTRQLMAVLLFLSCSLSMLTRRRERRGEMASDGRRMFPAATDGQQGQ